MSTSRMAKIKIILYLDLNLCPKIKIFRERDSVESIVITAF